jgi:outer membrane protein assembly factor BamB
MRHEASLFGGNNTARAGELSSVLGRNLILGFLLAGWLPAVQGEDRPEWCGGPSRNNVSEAKGLADGFEEPKEKCQWSEHSYEPFRTKPGAKGGPLPKLRNVLWAAPLGVSTYGSPVAAKGRVFVGGCLEYPGDYQGRTTAALWCFRESDGSLLWRFRSTYIAKLYNRSFGITATPTVEDDRVYVISHLGDVLCLDANGLADGNDGPFKEERELLMQGRALVKAEVNAAGKSAMEVTPGAPGELDSTDGDVIWRFDMFRELNCRFYNALTSAILIHGDLLLLGTCSTSAPMGLDQKKAPTPVLIALDRRTGKLVAVNDPQAAPPGYHGAHSSPAFGEVNGKGLVFYGNGRGVCYAFDACPTPGREGLPGTLRLVWQCDCAVPPIYRQRDGVQKPQVMRFEIVSTPVFHKNRVYVLLGNDLANSGARAGPGRLLCIDATKTGNITATGRVWTFDEMRSSSSAVAIADGLLFTADAAGNVYCLEAETGKLHWKHQTAPVWSSPLVADGKVYVCTNGRGLLVLAAAREKRVISEGGKLAFAASPAAANGVVYLASHQHLYALKADLGKGGD